MQTVAVLTAREIAQSATFEAPSGSTFEALLARNIADAERDLANGRVQWERARRRVVALEAVVDHWTFLELEHRRRRDGARRCVSA